MAVKTGTPDEIAIQEADYENEHDTKKKTIYH
jgi:hypothetical protein